MHTDLNIAYRFQSVHVMKTFGLLPVWDGQAPIHSSLQGPEHLVARGGSSKPSVQVAGESTRLPINALHIELISGHLNLALVHLIQAKFIQKLKTKIQTKSFITAVGSRSLYKERCTEIGVVYSLYGPAADQCSRLLRSSSNLRWPHTSVAHESMQRTQSCHPQSLHKQSAGKKQTI